MTTTGLPHLETSRPPLLSGGHVLVFTSAFYLPTQGSAVVMRNLLSCFDPTSYTVVTYGPQPDELDERLKGVRIRLLHSGRRLRYRGGLLWRRLRQSWLERWAVRYARLLSPQLILGVYPDMHMLKVAQVTAKALRIPFVAYFHDLLEEVYSSTSQMREARNLQSLVFEEASSVLVIGQGMADHYRSHFGIHAKCIQHIYPKNIVENLKEPTLAERIFIGGSIYDVNDSAILRLLEASRRIPINLVLATSTGRGVLKQVGLLGDGISIERYSRRETYLDVIRQQAILAVGLNWPEESSVDERELATAFPTKIIEYLFSGRPILVHCPDYYFLARFFREHECGVIITEKSTAALTEAIRYLLDNPEIQLQLQIKAAKAAETFSSDRVANIFKNEVLAVSKLAWREKSPHFYDLNAQHGVISIEKEPR